MYIHLEYANPVLGVWCNELCQGIMTLQCCMGQITLPHILKDDMGEV